MAKCEKCKGILIPIDGKLRCENFPIRCDYQVDNPKPDANLCEYIVFDFETTGTGNKDRIIEVAAVKVINGVVVSEYQSLVNPGIFIKQNIVDLTGISNEMLLGAKPADEVLPEFMEWCGTNFDYVVGHNAVSFDCRFLKKELKTVSENRRQLHQNQIPYTFKTVVDTLKMAKDIFPIKKGQMSVLPNHKQVTLAEYYGIKYNAHRALDDVKALQKVYVELCKENDKDYRTFL